MTENTKTKGSRYTEEQTTELVTAYTSVETQEARDEVVSQYATKFDKNLQSIRAKLSSERVYVAKERTTKGGDPIVRKEALVAQIATLMGEEEETIGSIEKATKPTLQKIIAALTQ